MTQWAKLILTLYPRAWRMRYADEMLALLEVHPLTLWTLADLALGALDAHRQRGLLPEEVFTMTQQIRTSANALFVAYALFLVAWVMVPFIHDWPVEWQAATANHPEIPIALLAFEITGVAALFAILIGGVPIIWETAQSALRDRRRDILWRLATPILLGVALVAYAFVAQPQWFLRRPLGPQDMTPLHEDLRISFFALAFIILGVSAWALISAVTRSQLGERVVRFTVIPGVIVTLALCVGFVALVTLTVLVFADAPQLAEPGFLMPGFDLLLACACGIAIAAVRRMRVPATSESAG